MEILKMLADLTVNKIKLGSESHDSGRRVVIIRNGRRMYGSKSYKTMDELNKAWVLAIKYEYNKLTRSVTK